MFNSTDKYKYSEDTIERWQVIDKNFIDKVSNSDFSHLNINLDHYNNKLLDKKEYLNLLTHQLTTRGLDLFARELKQQNLGFYSIASSGHENNVALSYTSDIYDPALLHYRSSAFLLNRAYKYQQQHGLDKEIRQQIRSLVASKYEVVSHGRHKVLGNIDLNIPPQTSTIASHLPKAVGLALSINSNKVIKNNIRTELNINPNSVVLCSFGDASFNHSTAQGAFNTASILSYQQIPVPIVFICEDNNIGISVKTPSNWIKNRMALSKDIYYIKADGLNLLDSIDKSKQAIEYARVNKKPVFLHISTVRLMGHAGSDIEKTYLTLDEIKNNEAHDPILYTAKLGIDLKYIDNKYIIDLYNKIKKNIVDISKSIIQEPKLTDKTEIVSTIVPYDLKSKYILKAPKKSSKAEINNIFKSITPSWYTDIPRNMAQMINLVLAEILLQYKNTVIFGEDVGKKGGVYNITNNLQKVFGRKRVFDTILDEQTILGTAIGFAQNNLLPIVEIQFLAYIHNAIDQLRGEAATQAFFSAGRLSNPMIIRIPALAYQKGFGGHFHNDNSIAALRDIPGIIIASPANGMDAVKIMRVLASQAYTKARICVFLEPIALYYNKQDNNIYPENTSKNKIALGDIDIDNIKTNNKKSNKLIILSYANGHNLSKQALNELSINNNFLDTNKIDLDVINIRWLKPLPIDNINKYIIEQSGKYNKINIIIVDECRMTGSVSEELLSLIYEGINMSNINLHRLTGEDSFIPLGAAAMSVLPSVDDIINKIQNIYN